MKVGVFGGCFNPVHHGHLRLAVEAREILELERVELVPAAFPPHKGQRELLPFGLRCRLVQTALHGLPGLNCSLIEGGRPGPSYTGDTLEELARVLPGSRLFFLLGVPDLLTLPSWKNGLALTRKAHFVAVSRQDMGLEATRDFVRDHWPRSGEPILRERGWRRIWEWSLEGDARSILLIQPPFVNISSTMIREYWRKSRNLRFLAPEAVLAELTRKQGLVDRYWITRGTRRDFSAAEGLKPDPLRRGSVHGQ
ncbi:MAG: nicotinate (nicotinamide) nucleotide adenylyltransferase [Desulfovibrionales bacterium]|nr:MAG: nicotinate (nicotinamide) nucleotide adenylyltransferase [Desulfovibrionales bacterium]